MTQPNTEAYLEQHKIAVQANPTCGMTRYNYAVALLAQKRFAEAEHELHEAVGFSPTFSEAYVLLGGIRMHQDDLEGCLLYNQRAVNARSNFAEGYGNIGFVNLQMGNIEAAIEALEKAVAINPNFIQAQTNLGNAYLMNGQIDKSIEANKKVLEIEPAFAVAHNNLAIAYLEKGETALAVTHCDKAELLGYEVAPEIKKEIDTYR
jgi:tetratricopeptide (TPR) repeat protein